MWVFFYYYNYLNHFSSYIVNLCHSVNRSALRGIFNGVTFGCLAQSTGFLVFITYAVHIFDKVGAKQIDPYVSSIALAIVQILATLCTTTLSDTLGRKALLISSLLGSAFGLLTFAAYSYFKSNGYDLLAFEWVPVTSLSFVIFTASAGCVPLMFICMVEHLPSKVMPLHLIFFYNTLQLRDNFRFAPSVWPYAISEWIQLHLHA